MMCMFGSLLAHMHAHIMHTCMLTCGHTGLSIIILKGILHEEFSPAGQASCPRVASAMHPARRVHTRLVHLTRSPSGQVSCSRAAFTWQEGSLVPPLIWSVEHVDSRVSCRSGARPECRSAWILRAHAAKPERSSIKRGTQTVPLRSFLSRKMRPSICDQRGSKLRVVGSPVGCHPLIGQTVLPLLCWVRGARGPSPRDLEGA